MLYVLRDPGPLQWCWGADARAQPQRFAFAKLGSTIQEHSGPLFISSWHQRKFNWRIDRNSELHYFGFLGEGVPSSTQDILETPLMVNWGSGSMQGYTGCFAAESSQWASGLSELCGMRLMKPQDAEHQTEVSCMQGKCISFYYCLSSLQNLFLKFFL